MKKIVLTWKNSWFLEMSKIFLVLLVFCMPLGSRLQFETQWSDYGGQFNEYLTYFVYFTDILLILLLGFWLIDMLVKFWKYGDWDDWKINPWQGIVLIMFGLTVFWGFYSTLWSNVNPISWYKAFRLFSLFGLLSYLIIVVKNNLKIWKLIFLVFIFSIIIQAIWGIGQYVWQHDFGMWWLGESILTSLTAGVAKIDLGTEKYIRAYGLLPHANIYAFYLFSGLVAVLISWQNSIIKLSKNLVTNNIYFGLLLGIISVGLLVSFSRITWLAGGVVAVGFLVNNFFNKFELSKKNNLWWLLLGWMIVVVVGVFVNREAFLVRTTGELTNDISYQTRQIYNESADNMISRHYYNGWGVGSFVYVMPYLANQNLEPWMYQPVHNFYKLVWAELGVIGFLGLALMMLFALAAILLGQNKYKVMGVFLWLSSLILQLFDHYMWDIWQGQLLWVFMIGMMLIFYSEEFGYKIVKK